MKLCRMFGRSIRDAFKSVFRNFSLSLASISCITITLIIVAISLIASLNVNNFTKEIKEDVTMLIYVKREVPQEELQKIGQNIQGLDNIATCVFKSNKTVKEEFQSTSELFKNIMDGWTDEENPLKNMYLVTVKDIENIKKTSEEIKSMKEIEYVDYGEETVNKLVTTFRIVEKVTVVIVIALVIVTVFLIINTIKLTIFSRKREISIMRLVGASNFTIKNPFVIEGMVLGIIGSIIPIILTTYGYLTFYNHFEGQLFSPLIKLIKPEPFIYMLSGIILIIGMSVGMLGSYRAVRKYLKV